jgi:hypothetical protein
MYLQKKIVQVCICYLESITHALSAYFGRGKREYEFIEYLFIYYIFI